jgi:hypothetical protein
VTDAGVAWALSTLVDGGASGVKLEHEGCRRSATTRQISNIDWEEGFVRTIWVRDAGGAASG